MKSLIVTSACRGARRCAVVGRRAFIVLYAFSSFAGWSADAWAAQVPGRLPVAAGLSVTGLPVATGLPGTGLSVAAGLPAATGLPVAAATQPAGGASLESAASKASSLGRNVAMSLIGLGFALAAIRLVFKRSFREAAGVIVVGMLAILLATPAGVNVLHGTVNTLFGGS